MQETQETRVQFLVGEDPLEYELATHSSILAWKIPWAEEPGRLQSRQSQRVSTTEHKCRHPGKKKGFAKEKDKLVWRGAGEGVCPCGGVSLCVSSYYFI